MKKYDLSLFVKNNNEVMEEVIRVKSNDAKYIYKKLIKSQYDEAGNKYLYYKDSYFKNNKTNEIITLDFSELALNRIIAFNEETEA